jgi:hypothetical protein
MPNPAPHPPHLVQLAAAAASDSGSFTMYEGLALYVAMPLLGRALVYMITRAMRSRIERGRDEWDVPRDPRNDTSGRPK